MILVIDVGTTGLRAGLVTPEGDARLGEIVGRCLEEAGLLDRLLR